MFKGAELKMILRKVRNKNVKGKQLYYGINNDIKKRPQVSGISTRGQDRKQ
jgi:hypothetical protein